MYVKKDQIPLPSSFPLVSSRTVISPKKDEIITYHWHDCLEITYVLKGRGRYLVNGKEYLMEPGDIILFNNVEPHAWEAFAPEEMVQNVLVFSPSLIWAGETNLFDYQYLKSFTERSTNFSNKISREHPAASEISELLGQIDSEYQRKDAAYQLMIKAKLLQLIANLIRFFLDNTKTSEKIALKEEQLARLEHVLDYINESFLEEIRLSDAALKAHMNTNYFSSFFKKTMGLTFKEYIIRLRIKHAMALQEESKKSITEVAMESGFHSMSNFYKAYRKYSGK